MNQLTEGSFLQLTLEEARDALLHVFQQEIQYLADQQKEDAHSQLPEAAIGARKHPPESKEANLRPPDQPARKVEHEVNLKLIQQGKNESYNDYYAIWSRLFHKGLPLDLKEGATVQHFYFGLNHGSMARVEQAARGILNDFFLKEYIITDRKKQALKARRGATTGNNEILGVPRKRGSPDFKATVKLQRLTTFSQ